jgi:SAM-dependent methyltransferase
MKNGAMDEPRDRFDRNYYERYYRDPRTRVTSAREVQRLGRFVCSYLAHLDVPVKRVLDAGCGVGHWRAVIAEHYPAARYQGIEVSAYLCAEYGWKQASIADYRPRGRFDLVVCQGVLQYLAAGEAEAAIDNLARLCRGALYLEALTIEDWRDNCDRRATDGKVHLRPAAWYRRRLARAFRACGGGVFVHKDADAVLYALEAGAG